MNKLKQIIKDKLGDKRIAGIKKCLPAARVVVRFVSALLVMIMCIAVITFFLLRSSGNSPSVFGWSLHRISSAEMEPELNHGDIILNRDVKEPTELQVGDIITFEAGAGYSSQYVTRRVSITPFEYNGTLCLAVSADADNSNYEEIEFSAVKSKYVRKAFFLMFIYRFFFSGWGIAVFAVLLAVILFIRVRRIIVLTVQDSKLRSREEEDYRDDDDAGDEDSEKKSPSPYEL